MRRLRAGISHHDSAARFQGLGVDIFLGDARFIGSNTINVDGTTLRFRRAVIATALWAAELPIPGLATAGVLTNETVFSLTALPRRLAVIGAGPIGRRNGPSVCPLWRPGNVDRKGLGTSSAGKMKPRHRLYNQLFAADGVDLRLNTETIELAVDGQEKRVYVRNAGSSDEIPLTRCSSESAGSRTWKDCSWNELA